MFSGENSIIQCSQPLEGSSLSVILLDCKWTDQGLQARGAERGQKALGSQQAGAVGSSWTLMGVGPLMSKPRRVRGPQGGSADNHSPFHAWGNLETQKCQSAPGACSPPGAVVDGGRGSLIQGLFQVLEAPPKPHLGPPAPAAHTASAAPLAGTVALRMQHHRRAGHRAERQAGAGSPSPLLFKQPWLQLHYPPPPRPPTHLDSHSLLATRHHMPYRFYFHWCPATGCYLHTATTIRVGSPLAPNVKLSGFSRLVEPWSCSCALVEKEVGIQSIWTLGLLSKMPMVENSPNKQREFVLWTKRTTKDKHLLQVLSELCLVISGFQGKKSMK